MAVKTTKVQSAETPSERFERVMQKVTDRQRKQQERSEKVLRDSAANATQ